MKQLFYILFICTLGCNKTTTREDLNKSIQKPIVSKNSESDSIINPIFKYEDNGNIIKADTFKLKNSYTLIIYPTKDSVEKCGVINYRIISKKNDKSFLLSDNLKENYIPYFKNIDFQNYFALHSNGGGTSNLYFWLYDKRTGLEVLTDSNFKIQLDFDLKNELILYTDEDNEYKKFIYDIKTKVKTFVDIPQSFTDKQECTRNNYFEKTSYIKRVTDKYYFIAFRDCPSKIEFRVKRAK